MSFDEYGLSPELLSGLADVRIEKPTSLQHEVLSAALQGKHMLVKTEAEEEGAFLIPALQKIAENGEVSGTQVLILTPSTERAKKIDELVWAMGYHAQISSALLSMKGDKSEQEEAVLDGAPVVVANPGRLVDILEKNNFQLPNLKFLVIDEAHNMENFNLVNRVKDILRFVEGEPQALIFSNQDNKATKQLADITLKSPELIGFKAEEIAESENNEAEKEETESIPKEIDLEKAEEKLSSASVKVVLKKDIVEESVPEEVEKEEETETASASKPEEKSDEETTEEDTLVEKPELTEEELKAAEEKLQKAGVKIVLKKDIEEAEPPKEKVTKASSKKKPTPVDGFEQGYINVPTRMKISILMSHLEEYPEDRVIVFAASKRTIDRLFRIIRKKNWSVASVSDNLDEETYQERFARFTSGEMRILLVGGIAADKVNIEDADQIINYDVPSEVEEYSYRAELVGKGKVKRIVSLVSGMDKEDIDRITNEAGFEPVELPLPKEVVEKKEKKKAKATPKAKVEVKKKPAPKKNKKPSTNNRKSSGSKPPKAKTNNRNNNRSQNNNKAKSSKGKKTELPRPNYEGLSGGREGNKSSGVFGWVKKLFD